MTHTLDISTDLDDLLVTIGDLTADAPLAPSLLAAVHATTTEQPTTPWTSAAAPVTDEPSLISPRLIRAAWYQ